jgi:hypothetical protein
MKLAHFVCLVQFLTTASLMSQAHPASLFNPVDSELSQAVWPRSGASNPGAGRMLPAELNPPGVSPRINPGSAFPASSNAQTQAPMFRRNAGYSTLVAAPSSIVVADVNGDGNPDEIVLDECTTGNNGNCIGPGVVSVLLGNGDGTFQKAQTFGSGGYFAIQVLAADINGNGKIDLIVLNSCATSGCGGSTDVGSIGILFGDGDGTFQPVQTFLTDYSPSSITAGDVNGDGKIDLIVSYFCDPMGDLECPYGAVDVYLGNGNGSFQPAVDYSSGGYVTQQVVLGDMNGDGKPDLIVANCGSANCYIGTVGVLLNNGNGTFQTAQTYISGGVLPLAVAVGDVNGDGKLDVVVDNDCLSPVPCSEPVIGVLLGNGDGTLQPPKTYNAGGYGCFDSGYCPVSIALADVNQDGKLDIVAPFSILLGNGDGTFQPPVSYSSDPCRRGKFAVADLNGDGKADISIANYYAKNDCNSTDLTILLNISTASTTTSLISSLNPAFVTQTITYTATVASAYIGTVSGSVLFKSGGTSLGSVPLVNGQASIRTLFTSLGPYFVAATYLGDVNNAVSTSATLKQVVNRFPTSASVTSSPDPSSFRQSVTLTATVTSSYGSIPDGELVIFEDNGVALAAERLCSGIAQFNTSTLPAGTNIIRATFEGDSLFAATVSPALKQFVNKSVSSALVPSSLNAVQLGK